MYNSNESVMSETTVKQNHSKGDAVSSDISEANEVTRQEVCCSKNNVDSSLECPIENTPCKVKAGSSGTIVLCTSTPLPGQEQTVEKGIDLSVIKEEDESELLKKDTVAKLGTEIKRKNDESPVELIISSKEVEDHSVLKKDQLSLLIDRTKAKSTLSITQCNDSLTLQIRNQTIVYNNTIDKTIDDLLLEDEELLSIKELNQFETESDRQKILSKLGNLKDFVSKNEEENKDNNDPEWELLKKLETDDERYKEVRKIWRNLAIPDLKQNLSSLNWRKKNSMPKMKNISPIPQTCFGKRKLNHMYDCTEVFDVCIQNLHDFYNKYRSGMDLQHAYDSSIIASANKRRKLNRGTFTSRHHGNDIFASVQERLKRYEDAKKEIKAVHTFYNGLKNQGNGGYGNMLLMNHKERRDILDIENMINCYSSWYD